MKKYISQLYDLLFDNPIYIRSERWYPFYLPMTDKYGREWLVTIEIYKI